jgi:chromosomal replication initiator protein
LAREALVFVILGNDTPEITPTLVKERVAQSWGVPIEALASKKRTKEVTAPRQVAMYLIRELLDLPLVEIGRMFGGRDHSTVIHSIQKVEEDLAKDDRFHARVQALRAGLTG